MIDASRKSQSEAFGTCNGAPVERVQLRGEGLAVSVLTYGAVIQEMMVDTPGGARCVVLGFDRLEDYIAHSPYMGCIAGRFANRIRDGRFTLDGREYQLSLNENGRTHLHGGNRGFGQRVWALDDVSQDSVRLSLVSPDGEEGYPGTVQVACTYRLSGPMQLSIELTAATDAPTIINLAAHSYFNLAGDGDIRGHRLAISAPQYLPVDDDLIPTGEFRPVAGSEFDFRNLRLIERGDPAVRYDHNFVVAREAADAPRRAARLEAPDGSLALEVWSTEPGLQFYDGSKIAVPVPGLGGRRYGPFSGLCLEPQRFPDSPNHPDFTDAVLRPGEIYRQVTEYRFSFGSAL